MQISDFKIGEDFYTTTSKWRCTDIGTHFIIAIRWPDPQHEPAESALSDLWLAGPPYVLPQEVLSQEDMLRAYRSHEEMIEQAITSSTNHPGFPNSDMEKLLAFPRRGHILSPYEKRYRSGLLEFDRVRGDEILHPYDWEEGQNDKSCQVKVYDVFLRTWGQVDLEQWLALPPCTEDDLARVMKLHPERKLF